MVIFLLWNIIFSSFLTFAHSGRLADDGCHFCNTRCEEKGYTPGTRHSHQSTSCDPSKGTIDPLHSSTMIGDPTSAGTSTDDIQHLVGKVVHVADGDSLTVLTEDKRQIKIRLYGVDAPERGQAFGQKAKQFLADAIKNKKVFIEVKGRDRYGRWLGLVKLEDSPSWINLELIQGGYSWVYREYCKEIFCKDWERAEEESQGKKTGLWQEHGPLPPWKFRKNSK